MEKPDSKALKLEAIHTSPATLILQWLAYAFWGWLGVVIIWLSAITFSFFVQGNEFDGNIAEAVAYPLAATIVLAIIAVISDMFYSRRECTTKKTGMESIIMIIHTVLFALLGIAAIVVAVFSLINMLISTGVSVGNGAKITLYTSFVGFVFYAVLALRVALVGNVKNIRKISWITLLSINVIMLITSLVGPIAFSINTKQDRLIETSLNSIVESINQYVDKNNKLPDSLSSISLNNKDAETVIAEELIKFKPNIKPAENIRQNISAYLSENTTVKNDQKTFFYEICTTYIAEKKVSWNDISPEEYPNYISPYSAHPKGDYCYKLSTSSISSKY
ncbi:hypothetical protein EOL73_02665 [Candidatus Saccharibacteria bacterium]|nr:hypothetical protein [Candidatus Saccharibacteria bacterium]